MCFLVVIGCLRPTNDFETLTKDPKLVFQFVKDKISSVNGDKYVNITDFSPWELKHMVGAFAENLRSMVCLSQPTRVWKHTRGASFQGCLGVILVDLDAVGHKFAANFWPKTVEKTYFLWKLRFSQTFYFWHSFWKTLYVLFISFRASFCQEMRLTHAWEESAHAPLDPWSQQNGEDFHRHWYLSGPPVFLSWEQALNL